MPLYIPMIIPQGGSIEAIDTNNLYNPIIYLDGSNNVTLQTSQTDEFVYVNHNGGLLCAVQAEGLGGFQLGNGIYVNGTGTTFAIGPIIGVDANNNTFVQGHPSGTTAINILDNSGNVVFTTLQSASAPAVATSGTISTTGVGMARVAPTGNVTGIILQAGVTPTQEVVVVNESAFTITFAAVGTSHVADGTLAVIAANRSMFFTWNSIQSKWYHS